MVSSASKVDKSVFVDRYGRRRRAVVSTGLVLAIALLTWLGVMCFGFAGVVQPGADGPAATDAH
jgi:hypothetical protein